MATATSIGRRRMQAIECIQNRCAAFGGGRELTIPTYSRHGQELLLVFQLEAIAKYLEGIEIEQSAQSLYEPMTNKKLVALIVERKLDKGKARSKPELIAILEAADQTAEQVSV